MRGARGGSEQLEEGRPFTTCSCAQVIKKADEILVR